MTEQELSQEQHGVRFFAQMMGHDECRFLNAKERAAGQHYLTLLEQAVTKNIKSAAAVNNEDPLPEEE